MKTLKRTLSILYWSAVLGLASGVMLAGCGRVLDRVNHGIVKRK